MVCANVIAAETDAEASRLFTSLQQAFLGIISGARSELRPPIDSMDGRWSAMEAAHVHRMTRCSAVGSPATIRRELDALIEATDADEIIATAQIFDHAARLRSFEITARVFAEINTASRPTDGTAPATLETASFAKTT